MLQDQNRNAATVIKTTFALSELPIDVGFSWYRGAWNPSGNKSLDLYGVHFNWLAHNWTLKSEVGWGDVDQDAGINPVAAAGLAGPAAINTSTDDYKLWSWYVEGTYTLLRWGENSDRYLRAVFRYDAVDTNNEAVFNPFDRDRYTIGSELQFVPGARIRYEWQYHTFKDFAAAPGPFLAAGGEEHVQMHMASVIFYF